ncbi:MAG: phosphoribosylanthranilate isomerase [Ruminococcus sp.]|nr:phosphoribosylanthranilate isomerase [Ruminococcus sp.]
MSTKVKLCGFNDPDMIVWVNRSRPDYVGYVFAEKSRRFVTPETAALMTRILDECITPVGVFVDSPFEYIDSLRKAGTIRAAQLHGNEPDDLIKRLQDTGLTVIKAFEVRSQEDIENAILSPADFVLLDSGKGSGVTFDHSLLREFHKDYFLAGGLTPENVGDAIEKYHPYAVDASSSLETNGTKDYMKILAFTDAVRKKG